MFAASIQGGGVLAKASLIAAQVQCRPDSPWENLSVGVGSVCWTSLPTDLSEWELGPCHSEWSPIGTKFMNYFYLLYFPYWGC